jgi:hypothetical protein
MLVPLKSWIPQKEANIINQRGYLSQAKFTKTRLVSITCFQAQIAYRVGVYVCGWGKHFLEC